MILQYIGGATVTGVFAIATLLLTRHFTKKDKQSTVDNEREERIATLEELAKTQKDALSRAERDNCRIQMLIMMMHYAHETEQIMKLAEHYFSHLHGDWYMTGIFNNWLVENNIGKPEWFDAQG